MNIIIEVGPKLYSVLDATGLTLLWFVIAWAIVSIATRKQ